MKHIISLGAGVQSSTMALMAAHGEITPMPDCAIFADTGAEPKSVYTWLDWLETQLPFPVHRVMHKEGLLVDLMSTDVKGGPRDRSVSAPFFTSGLVAVPVYEWSDESGDEEIVGYASPRQVSGMTRRQCTREFKIQPIERKVRELVGLAKGQRAPKQILATQYIGISLDEATRMKDSRTHWIEHRWPLIEKRMTRSDCLDWMSDHGYPKPAKSACTFCPYHDDHLWRDLKANEPEAFQQAVDVDNHLRSGTASVARGLNADLYVHRSCVPLQDVDFSTAEERGQLNLFENECEGMCGV
jgi:hypothetical protein